MNEGWLCPRCKKINAPSVKQCDCKEPQEWHLDYYCLPESRERVCDKQQNATASRFSVVSPKWYDYLPYRWWNKLYDVGQDMSGHFEGEIKWVSSEGTR